MKSASFPFSIFIFLLSALFPINAQEPPASFTWAECVSAAKQNNPNLLASLKSFEAARADYRGSFNGLFPSLSLSNSYSDSDSSDDGSWSASGSANLDVLNFRTNAGIRSAAASLRFAEADFLSTSSRLRFALRQAYSNLLFAQEQVTVSLKIEELRRNNAELVSLKYDSGRESKGNMLRARAEHAEARASLAEAARNLRVSQQELIRQIGRHTFAPLSASGELVSPLLSEMPPFEQVAGSHPIIKSARASFELSEAGLKSAKSSLWPSLSAQYTRSFGGANYFPNDDPHWTASGVLSYPLFGGGPTAAYYDISSARRNLESSAENMRSAELGLQADLEFSWASLAGSIDQVNVQNQFLEAARQRNEEALVRYSSGLMTFENWELVVGDLVNFERSSIRALRDAMIAEAEWNLALGKTLEE